MTQGPLLVILEPGIVVVVRPDGGPTRPTTPGGPCAVVSVIMGFLGTSGCLEPPSKLSPTTGLATTGTVTGTLVPPESRVGPTIHPRGTPTPRLIPSETGPLPTLPQKSVTPRWGVGQGRKGGGKTVENVGERGRG